MKLAAWLEHRRLTHEAFGVLIGAERSAVTRYVHGRMPKSAILARIVAATGGEVTANDFVDSAPQPRGEHARRGAPHRSSA